MQQSCSSLKAFHSARVFDLKTSATFVQPGPAGRVELVLDEVPGVDAFAEPLPELGLERAAGHPAVGGLVGQVTEHAAAEHRLAALLDACRRRSSAPAVIAAQDIAPSVIEMSTIWPLPVRCLPKSAVMTPKAAVIAPPPMSPIWAAGWIGGPPFWPVIPSRPVEPR